MFFKKIKLKIILFFKIFILAPKIWQKPKKTDILIYDASGSELLLPYFKGRDVSILYTRGEFVNIFCLFCIIFNREFWKGKCLSAYLKSYVKATSPILVVTYIDNSHAFYKISKAFPSTKTILVQNGVRDNWLDLIANNTNYHVDYMCVFGYYVGKYYNKHISGNIIPIGSFKNNEIEKVKKAKDTDNILFISQWLNKPKTKEPFYIDYKGLPIYWEDFFEAETSLLNFLSDWCFVNNKKLVICGREKDNDSLEKDFYAHHLKVCLWEYVPITSNYSSYKLIDAAEIVVSIDSTLGYESIARGKKTAVLSCRGGSFNSEFRKFGWPVDLPNNGPFWTNDLDEIQFKRVMDYLNVINHDNWEQSRQRFMSGIMDFDPGNTRFVALLEKLLPKSGSQLHAN